LEATLGAAAILAASSLAGMAPGAHEQPLWPLPWQPVADGWDDPVVASQVTLGLGLVGAACLAGLVALVADRAALRKSLAAAGLAAAAGAGMLIVPRIGAFAAPATPTSFFESPTGFTRRSVAAGGRLYAARCVGCHGVRGFGDGPLAGADRPAPLTGFHLLRRSDGEMFWIVTAGIPAGNRGAGMPGFGDVLSEEQRWLVTDYVRFLAGAEPSDSNAIPLHHHH
jgi:mono/diheme cytochrome c family protein